MSAVDTASGFPKTDCKDCDGTGYILSFWSKEATLSTPIQSGIPVSEVEALAKELKADAAGLALSDHERSYRMACTDYWKKIDAFITKHKVPA